MRASILYAAAGACVLLFALTVSPADEPAGGPWVRLLYPMDGSWLPAAAGIPVRAFYRGSAERPITRAEVFLGDESRAVQVFAPGKVSDMLSITLPVAEPGDYRLRVEVTDSAGRTASDSASIHLASPTETPRRFQFKVPRVPGLPSLRFALPEAPELPQTEYWNPTLPAIPRGVPDAERYRFKHRRGAFEGEAVPRDWYPVYPARPCGAPPDWRPERQPRVLPMPEGMPFEFVPPHMYLIPMGGGGGGTDP